MEIDLRVLELLSSKICHDLISPVSAINNGVELIEDIGGSVVAEAMQLIGNSSGLAARRLKMFRIAYGRAGSEDNIPLKDVRQIIEGYFQDSKISFHLPEQAVSELLLARQGSLKCLINLAILAEEVLPYGGAISCSNGGDARCVMRVAGRGAQLSAGQTAALTGELPIVDLTPRTIQPYMAGRYIAHFALSLSWQEKPEEVDLHLAV
jgi:histidine phosphotransferase ChpT